MIAGLILLLIESLLADRLRGRKQKISKQVDTAPETLTETSNA